MSEQELVNALHTAHSNIQKLARAYMIMLDRLQALEARAAKDEAAEAIRKAQA